jgi:hypothetical protein
MEFKRLIKYKEYSAMRKSMRFFNEGDSDSHRCWDTGYSRNGIMLFLRERTENEWKTKCSYSHVLSLIFNPSRLIEYNTCINRIDNDADFIKAISDLEALIPVIFKDVLDTELDDFDLYRINITKDIDGVPENIIEEYIMAMRRLPLYSGYSINKDLEKNCLNFRYKDSPNLVNDSKGIEFVIYKKHRASIDQKYPKEIQNHYCNTLRMELRYKRKFIRKKTEINSHQKLRSICITTEKLLSEKFFRQYSCLAQMFASCQITGLKK